MRKTIFRLSCSILCFTVFVAGSSIRGDRRTQAIGTISRLELINTQTGQKVLDLFNGAVVGIRNLGLSQPTFTVVAVTSGSVGSIRFDLDGAMVGIDDQSPYAMCGTRSSGKMRTCAELDYGQHTVVAAPYMFSGGQGTRGVQVAVTFSIVWNAPEPPPPVSPPVPSPVLAPVKAPVSPPVAPPVKAPVSLPVAPPVIAPVSPPVAPPVTVLVSPPVTTPIVPPVAPSGASCGTPLVRSCRCPN